ncbi:DUF2237 family protein [Sulfurimonas aquatica]|uniref:DUF2237 family protein n=1 Tax=Sulfurimonas aquatica TaxID=2672570 RepID=A0A975AZ62_9BACT|nr:DUF2237 domain-containing protein [Sulfurimonas aquatica]QSZ41185.1 DUF2237 family protein [Sulfurimonas aquatica]
MPKPTNIYEEKNALGGPLEPCSLDPLTGFYRTGSCQVTAENKGVHAVCIYATKEFLEYSKKAGNDISTPMPQYNFPGVKPGESWCLSGPRFVQAVKDGMAPHIFIHSTHQAILELIDLETLKKCAIDLD